MSHNNTPHDGPPLYFAYGSNLYLEQMHLRCPTSRFLRVGVLSGFRLAFRGDSSHWGLGGTATVLPAPEAQAPGVLYEMKPEDVASLNRYEGYPHNYQQIRITVVGDDNHTYPAFTYQKTNTHLRCPPSMKYFHQIWRSYKHHGLEEARLMEAVEDILDPRHSAADRSCMDRVAG